MKTTEFSIKQVAAVYAAVITLALLTWGMAHVRLGWANNVISISIAIIKTALVVTVFMNLVHARNLSRLWMAAGVGWLILMSAILSDYYTRRWDDVPQPWVGAEISSTAKSIGGGAPTPTIFQGR